jgi:hypothetical protein
MVETVVYELELVRGVNTGAACEYRDKVVLEDEMVAKDIRLSFSDILSVIVNLYAASMSIVRISELKNPAS